MSDSFRRAGGRRPGRGRLASVVVRSCLALGVAGCGASSGPTGKAGTTVTVDTAATFQTMEGFGAAVAFYTNWLTGHPNRVEIADVIFRDLGLDILRIANWSENAAPASFEDSIEIVELARASLSSLPSGPRILMSSWSPPASLKSNADTKNGGTLAQPDGAFAYAAFGQWWSRALAAYAARGVRPDYISIQNEPNFMASWESCRFGPSETTTRAGYGPALAAVHAEIQGMDPRPKLIGPETAGIAANAVQDYLAGAGLDVGQLDGIAHHLYSGGDGPIPDSFISAMTGVAAVAAGKPIFMTEYADGDADMVAVAGLISNSLTVEGVAAYVYWDLIWAPPAGAAPPGGLVTVENPFNLASWTTDKGYIVRDAYHAVRHYSRWVDSDWRRVGASSTQAVVKVAAFLSPDGGSVTVVMVNSDVEPHEATLATGDFTFAVSAVYRSSGAAERTAALGPLGSGATVMLPARSIATVTLTP